MIEKCPVCDGRLSESRLPQGLLFCERGHVLTIAPLDEIDLGNLDNLYVEIARLREAGAKARLATSQPHQDVP